MGIRMPLGGVSVGGVREATWLSISVTHTAFSGKGPAILQVGEANTSPLQSHRTQPLPASHVCHATNSERRSTTTILDVFITNLLGVRGPLPVPVVYEPRPSTTCILFGTRPQGH